jgi:hypothetical protein
LTATLVASTLANGDGKLTYNISGTPSTSGIAAFPISMGVQSCSLNLQVTPKAAVSSLDCGGTTYSATATALAPYTATAMVSYSGGNSVAYPASAAISSNGVIGLTATLVAGTLANGNGKLTYNITGTPTFSGIAAFPISMGMQTCSLNLQVAPTLVGSWNQTTVVSSGCIDPSANSSTICASNCAFVLQAQQ